jgi:hypothetical protein
MAEKDTESWKLVVRFGDAAAEVIAQMLRGHWMDDHGHKVTGNTAMIELRDCLNAASHLRDKLEQES